MKSQPKWRSAMKFVQTLSRRPFTLRISQKSCNGPWSRKLLPHKLANVLGLLNLRSRDDAKYGFKAAFHEKYKIS